VADQPKEVTRLVEAIKAFEAIEDDEACAAAVSQALKDWPDHQVKLRELRQQRVKSLKEQGKTWAEIGRLLGISAARAQQSAAGVSGAQRRKAEALKQPEAQDG
jgi:hypothetical protein